MNKAIKHTCVSTSNKTTEHAKSLGIDIVDINDVDSLDLVVDGADEIDPNRNGVKGGGEPLFRESSCQFIKILYMDSRFWQNG